MSGQRTERKAKPRRRAIPCSAACGAGVGSVQVPLRTADKTAGRYRHATDSQLFEQWPPQRIVAVLVRGKGLDEQGHHQARPDCAGREVADLLHSQGKNAQRGRLVRRHMVVAAPSPRHGCRAAVVAARRVRQMAAAKREALPGNRTYSPGYRPENRTNRIARRPEKRTYTGCFSGVPMPDFRTPSRNAICTGLDELISAQDEGLKGPRGPPATHRDNATFPIPTPYRFTHWAQPKERHHEENDL